jgi:hypothetical protein
VQLFPLPVRQQRVMKETRRTRLGPMDTRRPLMLTRRVPMDKLHHHAVLHHYEGEQNVVHHRTCPVMGHRVVGLLRR